MDQPASPTLSEGGVYASIVKQSCRVFCKELKIEDANFDFQSLSECNTY